MKCVSLYVFLYDMREKKAKISASVIAAMLEFQYAQRVLSISLTTVNVGGRDLYSNDANTKTFRNALEGITPQLYKPINCIAL